MTELHWGDPPLAHASRFRPFVDAMKTNPGQWLLIEEGVSRQHAEGSTGVALRRKGCKVATRKLEGGWSVWAMWPA